MLPGVSLGAWQTFGGYKDEQVRASVFIARLIGDHAL